ncbi:MAG TPA: hypothetical protein VFW05_09940 [Verrucomicrobiae bacterium]|nr:hypothetical protein [Verrucomicrobiae bacterium]
MSARWTLWRYISAGVAICLLALAVKCFIDARAFRRQFAEWETAKPIDTAVDFSTLGEFVAPFHQTCSSSHSEVIALRIPSATIEGTTITQLLQGAQARIEVYRKGDTNAVETADLDLSWTGDSLDGAFPVFFVAPFRQGEYEARLTVTAGAPALRGVAQRLEGRYLLCGLEAMPAEIAKIGGIGLSVVGGLIAVVLLYRVTRAPVRSGRSQQDAAPNGGPATQLGKSNVTEGPPSMS